MIRLHLVKKKKRGGEQTTNDNNDNSTHKKKTENGKRQRLRTKERTPSKCSLSPAALTHYLHTDAHRDKGQDNNREKETGKGNSRSSKEGRKANGSERKWGSARSEDNGRREGRKEKKRKKERRARGKKGEKRERKENYGVPFSEKKQQESYTTRDDKQIISHTQKCQNYGVDYTYVCVCVCVHSPTAVPVSCLHGSLKSRDGDEDEEEGGEENERKQTNK